MVADEEKFGVGHVIRHVLTIVLAGLAVVIAALPLHSTHAWAVGTEVKPLLALGARVAGDRARSRIVIDFDRKPDFKLHYLARPNRIVIDLPSTAFGFNQEDLAPRGLFKDIRYGAMDVDSARLVLTMERPARMVIAEAQQDEKTSGYRLVLDAEMVTDQVFSQLVEEQGWGQATSVAVTRGDRVASTPDASSPGKFVIAVDAGHGGIDAGATGATSKAAEKDITLAFARAFADRLNREEGIEAFLVRDKDEFLSLSERVTIARQRQANMLISVHADTLRQSNIRGATVYTISDKASDRMAEELAARENLSDEVAGVSTPQEPAEVTDILLDLTRRETQAFSIAAANAVVKSFEGQVTLINNPHRYAGFQVLRAHDVPSILLELGFLSNKEDEALLLDAAWREKIADLLTQAVQRYRQPLQANGG
ncbi:N-acetylmuramoyl-L-alanine amidase [Rhizobium sp. RU36D]|nr:N-acetylmuramoyl-L-alanine amidase [Rhizobium sp. RU36D]